MDKKMSTQLKWNPYVLMKNDECSAFFQNHFTEERKLLFIMGKGFDFRMNMALSKVVQSCPNIKVTCFLIDFEEGKSSSSKKYLPLVKENFEELKKLVGESNIQIKSVELWKTSGKKKRRVGDKSVSDLFSQYNDLKNFSDIIVDVSALPRGIYFSLIGKLLSLIEANKENTQNF